MAMNSYSKIPKVVSGGTDCAKRCVHIHVSDSSGLIKNRVKRKIELG